MLFKNVRMGFENLNKISKIIILCGLNLSVLMVGSTLLFFLVHPDINYTTWTNCAATLKTSTVVFAETIAGALFLDLLFEKRTK